MSGPLIGRRDAAPVLPEDAPQAPRRCDHCGRITTAWMVWDRQADHGPVEVVWCRDMRTCGETRQARARPRTWPAAPRR